MLRIFVAFVLSVLVANFLFLVLCLGALWGSMVPRIAGPAVQALSVLLVVLGIQMLIQRKDESEWAYAALSAVTIGLCMVLARMYYPLALVSRMGYLVVTFPTIVVGVGFSLVASAVNRRVPRWIKVFLAVVLLISSLITPSYVMDVFFYGEEEMRRGVQL